MMENHVFDVLENVAEHGSFNIEPYQKTKCLFTFTFSVLVFKCNNMASGFSYVISLYV